MDILNRKERMSAFLMFLLMFTITTGVLVFALFFNYKLPLKENEVLKIENEKINKQFLFHKVFSDKIDYIGALVDSLERSPERFQYLEQNINFELVELKGKIPADSLGTSKLYQNVILNINDLVTSKKKVIQVDDSKGDIEKLNDDIKDLEKENKDLFLRLQLCDQINAR
jgi:hypothetical protein